MQTPICEHADLYETLAQHHQPLEPSRLGIGVIHRVILLSIPGSRSCPPAPEPCLPDGPCIIKMITHNRDLTLSQH